MAEEGTLGLARAQDSGDDPSKEDLQRRMDEARDSITQTVTEIKDSVVHQYESVKETISETLDWREQVRKRPVAWAAGAAGASFLTGYCLTAMIKGNGHNHDCFAEGYEQARNEYKAPEYQPSSRRTYTAQSVIAATPTESSKEDDGPGLITRLQETQAYDRLKNEASTIGDHLVNEVSKTAKDFLVPAAVGWIQHWLEGLMPKKPAASQAQPAYGEAGPSPRMTGSSYQPAPKPQ
ncbi:MAG: hypothetical protein M3R68_00715 [Acidobacteriota bacterium]|nr:hypothetical protein [Acidobacteriota bacterium]